jgi:hypothetical protein
MQRESDQHSAREDEELKADPGRFGRRFLVTVRTAIPSAHPSLTPRSAVLPCCGKTKGNTPRAGGETRPFSRSTDGAASAITGVFSR